MVQRATILLLGDPGPVRRELLLRNELDPIWVATSEEAIAVAGCEAISFALIAPDFAATQALMAELHRRRIHYVRLLPPTRTGEVVLTTSQFERIRAERSPEGSSSPIDLAKVRAEICLPIDSISALHNRITHWTGLRFAADPRVGVRRKAKLKTGNREIDAYTVNLSVSGVLLSSVPAIPAKTACSVSMDLDGQLTLDAEVVRAFTNEGVDMAALMFLNVDLVRRATLERFVRRSFRAVSKVRLRDHADPTAKTATGDLVGDSPADADDFWLRGQGVELDLLRALVQDREPGGYVPPRLRRIEFELTAIERTALLEGAGPIWVDETVRTRIELAGVRTNPRYRLEAPEDVLDRAKDLVVRLAGVSAGQKPDLIRQIARIRAALFREIVQNESTMRDSWATESGGP
jgi:PilZ domain-containing protein